MKLRVIAAIAFCWAPLANAAPGSLPPVSVANLNGKTLSLPADLPGERTVLLLGFKHADRAALDAWVSGLNLGEQGPWIEMPLIGVDNGMIKGMITSGIKGGVKSEARRARMAPLFGDHSGLLKSLGLIEGDIQILVVDRSGQVQAQASGAYDSAKAAAILSALKP